MQLEWSDNQKYKFMIFDEQAILLYKPSQTIYSMKFNKYIWLNKNL